jgi:hypothetical protein
VSAGRDHIGAPAGTDVVVPLLLAAPAGGGWQARPPGDPTVKLTLLSYL